MPAAPTRAVLLLTVLPAVALAQAAPRAARPDAARRPSRAEVQRVVDSAATSLVASGMSPSLSVAVMRGKDTLVMKAYGLADLENEVPATPASVYRIGSITKQFTSAGVMRLVEQGKVGLDDDIRKYVPVETHGRTVTVRQLLNHTSGLKSYTNIGPRWMRRWREDMTPDTILALTAGDSLEFEPGTGWNYNNTGYVILGALIEKVSGRKYADYVDAELVRPLGLQATSYCETAPIIKHRARGYQRRPSGWENADYLSMSQPFSAGSLCSTTGDLARWTDALAHGRVVSPSSYALMAGPSTMKDGTPIRTGYGFGLATARIGERRAITHTGGINGFTSDMAWFPDDSLVVVVLQNAANPATGRLLRVAAAAALGDPLPGAARATLTDAERERYAGTYRLALPGSRTLDLRVWNEGGQLRVFPEGQRESVLVPQGGDAFTFAVDPDIRVRFALEDGKATKLTLMQNGGTFDGPRRP